MTDSGQTSDPMAMHSPSTMTSRPAVKVCGMRELDNIAGLCALAVDYMGLIFYEKSSRFVGPQTAEQRGEIIRLSQEAGIQRVGVFVNAERTYIEQMIADYALDVLQLHGEESAAECGFWKARGLQIWKVFSVGSTFDFGQLTAYDAMCDAFLFDTKGAKRGGNGRTFDWSVLSDYKQDKAFVLSGGIQVEMASEIADLPFAQLSVVDINSRFELSPAHKDLERIDQFLKKLKRK